MKRRTIKKEIRHQAGSLEAPANRYAVISPRVHKDVVYGYERELERQIFRLMQLHLALDPFWPHQIRWLDEFDPDFNWERINRIIQGKGGLWVGHWPEVGDAMTRIPFLAELRLCERHGLEYRFQMGDAAEIKSFSSRKWCEARRRV